ncbi:MAG: hypothetical protein K2X48_08880 [Chitinophagaceae bacterium]|nr:hypothetical protein [Chitinophagaceae bacterium]
MNRIYIVIVCLSLFSNSCSSQRNCVNCGVLLLKDRIYDTAANDFIPLKYWRDIKIWYKDSCVIQEGSHIQMNTVNNVENWEAKVIYYSYIDLRNMMQYKYKTFSDTATYFEKRSLLDSGGLTNGWDFFSPFHIVPPESREKISDTLIKGITYQRYSGWKNIKTPTGDYKIKCTLYLSCNKLYSSMFSYERPLNEVIKCPVVKFGIIDTLAKQYVFHQLEYLPRKLSEEELKVFGVWEKNAKKKSDEIRR